MPPSSSACIFRKPSEATVDRLVDATSGNPLFVRELAGSMLNGGSGTAIELPDELDPPESVMYLVEQSLRRFGSGTIAVLRAAAVAGRDFDLATVAACVGADETDVLDALEEPLEAGLIREHRSVPDRFSFSHALVRAGLYQNLSKGKRTRLHRKAGEALEAPTARGHAAERAQHFWHAREVGGAAKVVRVPPLEAGRLADAARAWEDAERHYRRGLLALRPARGARPAAARNPPAGARARARADGRGRAGESAASSARSRSLASSATGRLLAQASLGYGRAPSAVDDADRVLLELLEESLARLHRRASGRCARGCSAATRSSSCRCPGPEAATRADASSREAVELAVRTHDDSVLAVALASRHWTLVDPHRLEERCRVAPATASPPPSAPRTSSASSPAGSGGSSTCSSWA